MSYRKISILSVLFSILVGQDSSAIQYVTLDGQRIPYIGMGCPIVDGQRIDDPWCNPPSADSNGSPGRPNEEGSLNSTESNPNEESGTRSGSKVSFNEGGGLSDLCGAGYGSHPNATRNYRYMQSYNRDVKHRLVLIHEVENRHLSKMRGFSKDIDSASERSKVLELLGLINNEIDGIKEFVSTHTNPEDKTRLADALQKIERRSNKITTTAAEKAKNRIMMIGNARSLTLQASLQVKLAEKQDQAFNKSIETHRILQAEVQGTHDAIKQSSDRLRIQSQARKVRSQALLDRIRGTQNQSSPRQTLDSIPVTEFTNGTRRVSSDTNDDDINVPDIDPRRPPSDGRNPPSDPHQCFVAGTFVLTPDPRHELKPIELLKAGDQVVSCNTSQNQCVIRTIAKASVSFAKALVRVHLKRDPDLEEIIQTTPNHPFYLEDYPKPKAAQDLRPGDHLWSRHEKTDVVNIEFVHLENPVAVYNFQVEAPEGTNNYFVGEQLVLVHNCNLSPAIAGVAVSGATCVLTGAACASGVGAMIVEVGAMAISGGGSLTLLPVTLAETAPVCGAALLGCGATEVGVQNVLSVGKNGEDGSGESDSAGMEIGRPAQIESGKYDYLFGRARGTRNIEHNEPRSIQNAQQMRRLGVEDSLEGRNLLHEHFNEVVRSDSNIVRTFTNEHGSFEVRESLFAGPSGRFASFETTWHIMSDGVRRLTTIIPRGR